MMKRWIPAVLGMLILLAAFSAAGAEGAFQFAVKEVTLYEGEGITPGLTGGAEEAGDVLTFRVSDPKVASVSETGEITALRKGKTKVTAKLTRGKNSWKTAVTVTVLRRVTRVTLSASKLTVYDPEDAMAAGLLREPVSCPVLVIPAGKNAQLRAVCTPEDASNTKVTFATDDAGVARVSGAYLLAEQRGECNLTIASVQNPEVTETVRVVVIQPIRKLSLAAGDGKVAAGGFLQVEYACEPETASIQRVSWASRNPTIATVDQEGVVTGLKRGTAVIVARAADGSGASAAISINVTQTAEAISLDRAEAEVVVKGSPVYLRATLSPANTSDKSVHWESSDPEIATVESGKVTGHKAGACTITVRSYSNPALSASARIRVVQRATRISFTSPQGLSILTGESAQLEWMIEPEDVSSREVTFTSNHTSIVTVDQNGKITGHKRGGATITVKATDGSGKTAQIRVTVIQPVEGVQLKAFLHHVQLYDEYHRATAITIPKNANNQNMSWSTGDPAIATARGGGNACYITGHQVGTTSLRVTTEDGGFTAEGEIRVRDYNGAVLAEGLSVTADNRIRIVLRNMSDFTITRVRIRIDCYDRDGNPMVCNQDGESTSFSGAYTLALDPGMRSQHGQFSFYGAAVNDPLGMVVLTVTDYTDIEGYTWEIPESARVPRSWDWRIENWEDSNG